MIVALVGDKVDDAESTRLASPIAHAAGATAPMLLIHGTADQLVSWRESERMHAALQEAGKSSEVLVLEGATHAFQIQWRGEGHQRAHVAMAACSGVHLRPA